MYPPIHKSTFNVPVGGIELTGDLWLPHQATGIVLFAHGSGSSRLSPRNQMVASYLNNRGIATFLFDLLSYSEDREYTNRFAIPVLAKRLQIVTEWSSQRNECKDLRIAYFGARTGAAAALMAAKELPSVCAVVSRGGRPDLAMKALPFVQSAVLLIVGSTDADVLQLNQQAYRHLNCEKKLEIIPGATHLFEEKGAMEQVCLHAAAWFEKHFSHLTITL